MANEGSGGWEFSAGFLIGGLLGGVLGAAAAILMAPQSGEETRAILREKGIELKERAEDVTEDAQRRAQQAAAQAREAAQSAQESARLAMNERVSQVKDAIDTGKAAAEKKKEEMMQTLQADKSPKAM